MSRERALLSLLLGLNRHASDGTPLEDVLVDIAAAARQICNADSASVMLLDEERQELLCRASSGLPEQEAQQISFRLGEGVAGWVAEHGVPLSLSDTSADERFKPVAGQLASLRAICCVPMPTRAGVIGVITVASAKRDNFGAEDEQSLAFLAAAAAKDVENARLYRLAVTDPLTGAYNRQYLAERLPAEIQRHRRYQNPLSLVMIDIDHFKAVNDSHGHQCGDLVLREHVRRFKSLTRDSDSVVRYGGEEFVLLLPCTPLAGAWLLAERIRMQARARPVWHGEEPIWTTISGGVAELDPKQADPAQLVATADARLYEAKSSGRDKIV